MSLIMMNPRIPRYVPPVTFSGPGPGIYTRNYTVGGIYAGTYPFQVRIPTGYSNATPCRCLTMLDGASSRGNDGTTQMLGELAVDLEAAAYSNCIIIYSQWQSIGSNGGREQGWPMVDAVRATVESEWNVDPLRRYMIGFSLGTQVGWEALWLYPTLFAAACFSEGSVSAQKLTDAGATVSPFTNTQASKVIALQTPATGIKQFQNSDDSIFSPANAITGNDGYVAAGHTNYEYVVGTGGHSPNTMMAPTGSGATYITGWLFNQHL